MASYVPPEKNAAFVFYVSLESQAAPGTFQANPTLAAGDVKVATDDGAPANLATLPAVDADFTKRVKVSMSAGEMNGDNVTVIFSDAAGAEWYDLTVNIQTATNQIDDLATAAALAAGVTVATNGIAAASIATGAITSTKFAAGAIDAAAIADNAIDAGAIASNAITSTKIANGAITASTLASSTITSAKIATSAIDSTKIASGAITSAAFASGAISQSAIAAGALIDSKFGSGAITADVLAADAAAEIADAVWDEVIADHVAAGSFGEEVQAHALTSDVTALNNLSAAQVNAEVDAAISDAALATAAVLGTPAGASIAADIAAIEAQTDDIGAAGAGLTALGDTRLANLDATVSSRAAAATLTAIGSRIGSFTGTGVNNILGFLQAIMRKDVSTPSDVGGSYDDATDSLEAIRDRGDAAWVGSVDEEALTEAIVDGITDALSGVNTVTIVSTVAGATATVYQFSTWEAVFTLSGTPGLTGYENLIFAVKRYPSDLDAESVLYVNSATGLIYIGQAAATGASYGSLTADSATQFAVYVDAAEVASKIAANFGGAHTWTLKGIETGTTPDEAIVIATGTWRIEPGYVRSLT